MNTTQTGNPARQDAETVRWAKDDVLRVLDERGVDSRTDRLVILTELLADEIADAASAATLCPPAHAAQGLINHASVSISRLVSNALDLQGGIN